MREAHSSWTERMLWRDAFFLSPCLSVPSSAYILWASSLSPGTDLGRRGVLKKTNSLPLWDGFCCRHGGCENKAKGVGSDRCCKTESRKTGWEVIQWLLILEPRWWMVDKETQGDLGGRSEQKEAESQEMTDKMKDCCSWLGGNISFKGNLTAVSTPALALSFSLDWASRRAPKVPFNSMAQTLPFSPTTKTRQVYLKCTFCLHAMF